MVGDYWTKEQKIILKELHIDPLISSPERLKTMVNYFRTPDASLWAVTEGHGPFQVSKSLGMKVRGYADDGAVDWLMDETSDSTKRWFDSEWRQWLLSKPVEFSQAVDAYRQTLDLQIQTTEIQLKLRSSVEPRRPPRVRYGPMHHPFVESIFSRDEGLTGLRAEFEWAIGRNDISRAKVLSEKICQELLGRIAI